MNTKITIKKSYIKIAIIFICVLIGIFFAIILIKKTISYEAQKAKTEFVEKAKETINIDDTTAAKAVAKTIHKFTDFKNKVKTELEHLDSTKQ